MLNGEDMLARCREGDAVQLKDNLEKLTQCMFETRHKVERKKVWKRWWLVDFTPSSQTDVCVTSMNGTYSTLAANQLPGRRVIKILFLLLIQHTVLKQHFVSACWKT